MTRDPLEEALAVLAEVMAVDLNYQRPFAYDEIGFGGQQDAIRLLDRYGWIERRDGLCVIPMNPRKEPRP